MIKILAVCGTKGGQTERIVARIARGLAEQGHTVTVSAGAALPWDAELHEYDGFLVAVSAIPEPQQPHVEEFVRRNASYLSTAPSAFVCACGVAAPPAEERAEARRYMGEFLRTTGWRPRLTDMFAMPLPYGIKGITTPWTNDITDWAAVDRFAGELGRLLPQRSLQASVN